MKYQYPALAHSVIDTVLQSQGDAIDAAVEIIADRLTAGGVLQVFGTGHARIPVHEMAGRAGGLVAVNLVRLSDLAFRGGYAPSDIADPLLERVPDLAAPLFRLTAPGPGDVFLIASNSGINGVVVEFARLVKDAGLPLIALTSMAHTRSVASRHPSGQRLADLADVVIDNGAPAGDALLEVAPGLVIGGVSDLVGILIAQTLTEGVVRTQLARGETPRVFLSQNIPAGDAHNADPLAAFSDRVHSIEA